jgi:hypothetical protein
MLRISLALALSLMTLPALARPIPIFDNPKALLEAVYDQIKSYEESYFNGTYDPDANFDDVESFSTHLGALLVEADEKVHATGSEMGALDFSPFINGQDSSDQTYVLYEPKIKGSRAVTDVDIISGGRVLYKITFHFVDEGADRGWKIDEILLPSGDAAGTWSLSEYLADPLA